MTVFVLSYGLILMGVFETPEKAAQHTVQNINREANFRSTPVVAGMGHWTWNEFDITELPVR